MKPLKKSLELKNLIAAQLIPVTNGKPKPAFRFAAKAVLLQLMRYVKDDGTCYCSYSDIIKVVGCSRPMLTKIKDYWESEGIFTWTKGIANQFERKANTYQFREQVLRARLTTNVARETHTMPEQDEVAQETVEPGRETFDSCLGNGEGVARESYTLPIKEYSNGSKPKEIATEAKSGLVVFFPQGKKQSNDTKQGGNVQGAPRRSASPADLDVPKKLESEIAILQQKMTDELDKARSVQRMDFSQYETFKKQHDKLQLRLAGVEEEL